MVTARGNWVGEILGLVSFRPGVNLRWWELKAKHEPRMQARRWVVTQHGNCSSLPCPFHFHYSYIYHHIIFYIVSYCSILSNAFLCNPMSSCSILWNPVMEAACGVLVGGILGCWLRPGHPFHSSVFPFEVFWDTPLRLPGIYHPTLSIILYCPMGSYGIL